MKAHEIIEYYDIHPNVTLNQLSRISGWTVPRLKRLLMESPAANDTDAVAAYVAEGLGEW